MSINFKETRSELISSLTSCAYSWRWQNTCRWQNFDSQDIILFQYWRSTLHKKVKYLYTKHVITPIDKATSNVAFNCQGFYAQVLFKELVLQRCSTSNIYCSGFYPSTFLQPVNDSKNSIMNWVLKLRLFKFFCIYV